MDDRSSQVLRINETGGIDLAEADTSQQASKSSAPLPEHLVALPETTWAMWRWSCLRGAGFPIAQVLQFSTPACMAAIDIFLSQETLAEPLQQKLHLVFQQRAHKLHASKLKRSMHKAKYRVLEWKAIPVLPPDQVNDIQEDIDAWQIIIDARERALSEINRSYEAAQEQSMALLYEVVRDERFREAVQWQNHAALASALRPFMSNFTQSGGRAPQPKHARLIAKYLQRYCAKNDSIGFFGPVGWGRWSEEVPLIEVQPGPQMLASRSVYFETWVIEALGDILAQNRAILPWAVPRPMPFLHLDGMTLYIPFARPLSLSPTQAAVLATCDGRRTANEIAEHLLRKKISGLMNKASIFAILDRLRATHRIAWTFEASMEDWRPEQTLRQQLEGITLPLERRKALDMLDQLEQGRVAVADAAGNPQKLDQALEQLEATFTRLTHTATSRGAGKIYAARTLVYEDCRRAIDLKLGSKLLEELTPPLALLLDSARWFTQQAAQLYREEMYKKYRELVQKTGSPIIDFTLFWSHIQSLFSLETGTYVTEQIEALLQERWAPILALSDKGRSIHYSSEQLRPLVQKAFQADAPGWPTARYHSPDVLISADGPEAIQQGNFQFVLGEFHLGLNTLGIPALLSEHPDYAQLMEATALDFPRPRVMPVFSRHLIPAKRVYPTLIQPGDWRFILGVDGCSVSPERALRPGNLVLEERDDQLIVRARDGSKEFEVLAFFDSLVSLQVCDHFKILPPRSHMPRVTIDRVVVNRESWRFPLAALTFTALKDPVEQLIAVRRWKRVYGLPRFLFLRTPGEKKPCFIDMESLLSIDMLTRFVRQSQMTCSGDTLITVTEMLPDPEHLWLIDSAGNRYTSELRFVAVDQAPPDCMSKEDY